VFLRKTAISAARGRADALAKEIEKIVLMAEQPITNFLIA